MSYFPNPAIGSMFEYQNAVVMGIDQVGAYHPFGTSGAQAGTLDGRTFTADQLGSFA
jgi:hypothetical protein